MAGLDCLTGLSRWTCRGIIFVIFSVFGLIFTVPGMLNYIPGYVAVLTTGEMPHLENGTCTIDKIHFDSDTKAIFYDIDFASEVSGKKLRIDDAIWDYCDNQKYDCVDLSNRMLQNATKQFPCTKCNGGAYCRFPVLVKLRDNTQLMPYAYLTRNIGVWFGFTLTCVAGCCIAVILILLNFVLPCFISDTDNLDEGQSLLAKSTKGAYETPGKPLKEVI